MWNVQININEILKNIAEGFKRVTMEVIGESWSIISEMTWENMVIGKGSAGNSNIEKL